ncbi:MAG TPA: PQQ-binding-like beta-propeller repeat protein [Verrucomicrobiae bacterium]|nr:PQQ-binding-like beta-propeller repeat protein [Verrucomicrobiae bacterium]
MSGGPDYGVHPPVDGAVLERSRAWPAAAWISGLFCVVVCAVLLLHHAQLRTEDPLRSERLSQLKKQLLASPTDEALKERIRELDLQLRGRYFGFLQRTETGGWLLAGGILVFLVSLKMASREHPKLPMPQPDPDAPARATRAAVASLWSVGTVGLAAAAALVSLAFGYRSGIHERLALMKAGSEASALPGVGGVGKGDLPTPEEFAANWPRFRGPGGNGFTASTNFPVAWNNQPGAGVAWKSPVPAPGFGSPVVWNDRVVLSGGDRRHREIFCFDAAHGTLLWRHAVANVPGSPAEPPEVPDETGYAASTVATDGRRVYAIFANGDLAAVTLEGRPVWSKHLGAPKNPYGHAISLTTWEDRLIVQLDQGDAESGRSRLYAFDGASGDILWERPRPVPSSWATPIVIQAADQTQIITLGDPWVMAYAVTDGAELWRADCLYGEITPSPIFAGGLLFVISPSDRLLALRPDGRGDVSKTHLVWSAQDNVPDITSPVSNGELVFTVDSTGLLTCFDAAQGEKLWEQDLRMDCHASPTIAGDRLYVIGKEGGVIVARVARQFEELSRAECGEKVSASPALAREHIYIRGVTNLFCFGPPTDRLAQRE